MSFMLSCSSKRRFSIFRSLQDKEKKLSMPVHHTYLHEITYPGHTMGKKRRREGQPSALPCHRQTAPPVRVMLADLSGSIVFLKSSSFINPVIQLSAKAIPVWLKFSSQALSQKKKKIEVPGKATRIFAVDCVAFSLYLCTTPALCRCSTASTNCRMYFWVSLSSRRFLS